MRAEINRKKKSISWLKKIITVLITVPFISLFVFIGMLVSGSRTSNETTVEERFKVSSSLESPYENTLKGSYQYSFAFCGDPHMHAQGDGCFPKLDEVIRAQRVGFVIFGGDLTFLGKESEYENFVNHANSLTVPSYPALGNHDLYNSGWSNYLKYLGPSSYSFYAGNAKFIVIDSACGEVGEKQLEWLKQELRTNKQPLLFVISHYPVYGGLQGVYEFVKSEERLKLIELFEKYEVDYVLEGHYHGYVNLTVGNVHYITSGSFSEGLLDSGERHFLLFSVYGPNVNIEKIAIKTDIPVEYRDQEI